MKTKDLVLLAEECSEVIKAVTKILRFGLDSQHPDGGPTNKDELVQEIGDVLTIIERLGLNLSVMCSPELAAAIQKKRERLRKYGPEVIPMPNPEIDRLADFILKNMPEQIGRGDPASGESAVDVAIRLLSEREPMKEAA